MNYPLLSNYIEAIKSAEDNFDKLSNLRPVLDNEGLPVMSSGNFAVVFKMMDEQTGKLYAVKCFLKEQEGREEAYRLIAEELEYVSSTFLTPIKYYEKELFVDTDNSDENEFPVLLMDWVEGVTLDNYIRDNIGDEYKLSLLAYQFSRLAMWLLPQPFAHGDLKPDNILVRNDESVVLVDYDGMYVTSMKGQKARELGSPDFRHPSRTENDFDEHIDDFPLASILLSLKLISLQPSLLEEYGASDRLLFSEKDYTDISQCGLLKRIYPSDDSETNVLTSLFTLALEKTNLSEVSFRLFNLCRPKEPEYENLNTEVTEEDLANAWTDEYGVKYSADGKRLLKAGVFQGKYSIRKGTKVICDRAFLNRHWLTSINIPDSVTIIGDYAFCSCKSLTSINIPDGVTSIGKRTFLGCDRLISINIPNRVTNIGEGAFSDCCGLTSIYIPDCVTSIGNHAFEGCIKLTSINIPDSVTSIGNGAFSCGSKLTSIVVDKNNKKYDSRKGCNAIIEKKSNKLIAGCKNTMIPDSVTSIGDKSFDGCSQLTSIIIPDSITSIEERAFSDCYGLTSIIIPDSVTSIGKEAFSGCSQLTSIIIPDSITSIEKSTFFMCWKLTKIIIPKGSKRKFELLLPEYRDKLVEK